MASFTTRLATMTWAGTGNALLVQDNSTNKSSPSTFTINAEGPEQDTTAFDSTGVIFNTSIPGIRSWTVEITTRANTAILGNTGFVTFANGFVVNARSWNMNVNTPANETTAFDATNGVQWRSFVPGLTAWDGTYEGFIDDTAVLKMPSLDASGVPVGAGTGTFVLQNAASDTSISGSIYSKLLNADVRIGEVASYSYGYQGTGALTMAGGTNYENLWFANGALIYPIVGELVLTSTTGRTYTGNAFRTGVTINCSVDGVITATVRAQGVGPLVSA